HLDANYDYTNLLSHPNRIRTKIHSVLPFYTLYLNSATSFSVFAGPERSESHGAVLTPAQWSPAAGGSFGWRREHTSLEMNASRRVSGGGVLASAVHSLDVNSSVR